MPYWKASIILIALAGALTSCATIISGSTQDIGVTSNPPGAVVTAEPGDHRATTPATLVLRRKDAPYRVKFEMDGYEPYEVTIRSSLNGWVWGNLIIGGLIGIVVDSSSGAAQKLSPDELNANLIKEPPTSDAGHTRVYVFAGAHRLLGIVTLE